MIERIMAWIVFLSIPIALWSLTYLAFKVGRSIKELRLLLEANRLSLDTQKVRARAVVETLGEAKGAMQDLKQVVEEIKASPGNGGR